MVSLTIAYALHVLSAAFWTGATLYVAYAILPDARRDRLPARVFVDSIHRLLLITRWTGVVLPITGAYLIWVLYTPLEALTTTVRGWAVLSMLGLWGMMNGAIELGVLRMRRSIEDIGFGRFMTEGFPAEALRGEPTAAEFAVAVRPYILASAVCAVLLLINAALLAGGIPF